MTRFLAGCKAILVTITFVILLLLVLLAVQPSLSQNGFEVLYKSLIAALPISFAFGFLFPNLTE